jgi:hypothetical protein
VFIATYAGRVSSVTSSSPLGLPSDFTECSPTKVNALRRHTFRSFGRRLSPVGLLAHDRLTSELLRFL